MTENERFGLVFAKTGSINSGTGVTSHKQDVIIGFFRTARNTLSNRSLNFDTKTTDWIRAIFIPFIFV
jgi:hypothetical protein